MAKRRDELPTPELDAVVDAVLGASRALVAIAVRSLAAAGQDVTLPQFRALVVLAYRGPQRIIDLADELQVNHSTATRLMDRLVRRELAERRAHPEDGRASHLEITAAGRAVVAAVTARRRAEFTRILGKMTPADRTALCTTLEALSEAAGEAPEQSWSLGWTK